MKKNRVFAATISGVFAIVAIVGVVTSAHGQKAADGLAGGTQWLAAMDKDHDGTVSKEEFKKYMDSQFDKADVDHDGTLDAKELEQLRKSLATAAKP